MSIFLKAYKNSSAMESLVGLTFSPIDLAQCKFTSKHKLNPFTYSLQDPKRIKTPRMFPPVALFLCSDSFEMLWRNHKNQDTSLKIALALNRFLLCYSRHQYKQFRSWWNMELVSHPHRERWYIWMSALDSLLHSVTESQNLQDSRFY